MQVPIPYCTFLLLKLTVNRPTNKFSTSYGIQKFINVCSSRQPLATDLHQLNPIHTLILYIGSIISSYQCLGLPY